MPPLGSSNPQHIFRFCISLSTPHRTSPFRPCRPGTCVTYNWFINNVNRCFWSSLASCQLASILFYCRRLPDCIPLNARWHRMGEGDVFFILKRIKGLHRLDLLYNLCVSMSGRCVTLELNNALFWHLCKLSICLWMYEHIATQGFDPD